MLFCYAKFVFSDSWRSLDHVDDSDVHEAAKPAQIRRSRRKALKSPPPDAALHGSMYNLQQWPLGCFVLATLDVALSHLAGRPLKVAAYCGALIEVQPIPPLQ